MKGENVGKELTLYLFLQLVYYKYEFTFLNKMYCHKYWELRTLSFLILSLL